MLYRILVITFSMCLSALTGAHSEVICNQKSKVTNIRMGPSAKNYGIADTLKNGVQVRVLERVTNPDGYDYFKVEFRHTQTGKKTTAFVYNEAISVSCSFGVSAKVAPILSTHSIGYWNKLFGEGENNTAQAISRTVDGGALLAGTSFFRGKTGEDVAILKIGAKGKLIWQKTFGGKKDDRANALVTLPDGGAIIAGWTESKGAGYKDIWVIRIDSRGTLIWDKTFGDSESQEANAVALLGNGDFLITGKTWIKGRRWDAWIIRANANGERIWDKTFGGKEDDIASAITITPDGGAIIAGETDSKGAGVLDAWVIRVDTKGNLVWDKTFGGKEGDSAWAVTPTSDGGAMIAGHNQSINSNESLAWVIRVDAKGNRVWDRKIGSGNQALAITMASNGDAIVAGKANYKYYWVARIDSQGRLAWEKNFKKGAAYSLSRVSQKEIVIAGNNLNNKRFKVIRLNAIDPDQTVGETPESRKTFSQRTSPSNSPKIKKSYFGCDFIFENPMTDLSWASTIGGFQLKGLKNPEKFFYGRLCKLAKGKTITMLNVHKDGSFDKASNGYEIAYYKIGGCKSSIEFGIKNGKSVEVIVHYPRDCSTSNKKKLSGATSTNSDAVCYQIQNEDARYACLQKPFLTQNEDSRKILQGNCYNLSKLAQGHNLDRVCAREKSACYELTQDKWRQSCFSCGGTKRWAATAIAGSVLTCYK